MTAWSDYLQPDGAPEVYGPLSLRLSRRKLLRLRQTGERVHPIASREFRSWLEAQGGGLAETDWYLPVDAPKRLAVKLRGFRKEVGDGGSASRLAAGLLAALQGFPPGDHYGKSIPPEFGSFIREVMKDVRRSPGLGALPWLKAEQPQNGKSRRAYTGLNRLVLQWSRHGSPFWYTKAQVKGFGGRIRPGQRATTIAFVLRSRSKPYEDSGPRPGDELDDKSVAEAFTDNLIRNWDAGRVERHREYQLYNWAQTEGIPEPEYRDRGGGDADELVDDIERLVEDYFSRDNAPELVQKGSFAFYQYGDGQDRVVVPPISQFHSRVDYYRTLLHEMVHSTGHPTRLDRQGLSGRATRGDTKYSHEELVADMGAAWLLADAGVDPKTDLRMGPVEYCRSWLGYLKNDKFALVSAAGHARRACERILGVSDKPPSAREQAIAWVREEASGVADIHSAARDEGASMVTVSLAGRKTPLFLKTQVRKGSDSDGYVFELSAADVKAWRASRGKRTAAACHGLLLIPLTRDGGFEPDTAPPVLLRMERLFDAGLKFNLFRGLGGKKKKVSLKLSRPHGRKSWHISNARTGLDLRLRPTELLRNS